MSRRPRAEAPAALQDPRQENTTLALQRLYEELCACYSVGRPRRRGSGLTISDHIHAPQKHQAWSAWLQAKGVKLVLLQYSVLPDTLCVCEKADLCNM